MRLNLWIPARSTTGEVKLRIPRCHGSCFDKKNGLKTWMWIQKKWVFPPNHPFKFRFPLQTYPFWGTPIFGNTHFKTTDFFQSSSYTGNFYLFPKKKVAQLKEAEKKQSWQNQQVAAFNWNELIQNRRCRCTGIAGDAPLRQACKTSFHMTCAKVMLRLGLTWKLIPSKGQLQKHVQYKKTIQWTAMTFPFETNIIYICVSIPHQECNFVTMCDSRQNHATSNRTNIRLNNVQNVTFLARKYLQKLLQMLQIVNHHRWLSW